MRPFVRVLIGAVFAVGGSSLAAPARAQAPAPKGGHYVVVEQGAAQSAAYLDKESAFVVGKTVYLRSTKTLIGTIEKVDESHTFPPSFPKSPARAVLIRRRDRSKSWL